MLVTVAVTIAHREKRPAALGRSLSRPTVIFVTGSGPQDRDEAILGHRPFLVIADYLARHGIASLRYDDRGTAQSTGNFESSTTADFAVDAEAAVHFVKGIPLFQNAKTGLASEYGAIEETISPSVLELVASWINQRFEKH